MSLGKEIESLFLVVLAIIIVVLLWKALWTLAGIVVFILLVYLVYWILRGRL